MLLTICISSAPGNADRRKSLRRSWLQYLDPAAALLEANDIASVEYFFVLGEQSEHELKSEWEEHGDMLFVAAPEGYQNLWRKTIVFLQWANSRRQPDGSFQSPSSSASPGVNGAARRYFMHVDDDSFVRLDLLLPELRTWPKERFYWGYIWDPAAGRCTAPIRNQANKSYMPEDQYPLDYYPPFASGCGFILSWDLVDALLERPLPDYALLDPPFGIHLTGTDRCCLKDPVVPVHDDRVRPYRPIPIFRKDTLVQHYLQPAELRPFFAQATGEVEHTAADAAADERISNLYNNLVGMGLLRR